jgi:hypothetical protein
VVGTGEVEREGVVEVAGVLAWMELEGVRAVIVKVLEELRGLEPVVMEGSGARTKGLLLREEWVVGSSSWL